MVSHNPPFLGRKPEGNTVSPAVTKSWLGPTTCGAVDVLYKLEHTTRMESEGAGFHLPKRRRLINLTQFDAVSFADVGHH